MRLVRHRKAMVTFLAVFAFSLALYAQDQTSAAVDSRITESIDESKLVQLDGQVHPLAREQYDRGVVPEDFRWNTYCSFSSAAQSRRNRSSS
jgi:hypothetical protein